ncbi:MAG: undecaprenyldiphospho-muramoylpentapeptide beta-N-acetylglucosaminyltransferase [Lachnospiraceae bacterium]|nr:undecaprenyldiphospho-muramoylpentapeptide beta-N-acetylglucosaminyltransferase [Lachnospiraceae bacterium]
MKKVLLTGGGTAGHVTPNIALLPRLREEGCEVSYIGSKAGMERDLIEELGVPYVGIDTGKLRRYFDLKNLTDPFRVVHGFAEATRALREIAPDVVFSKGGYVAVPVVMAASRLRIPVIIHESDMTPGLANRLCIPRATKICANFPETLASLPADKAVLTGTPIRQELFAGSRESGLAFCGFTPDKPVMMVIGGSLGSAIVNDAVRAILPDLLGTFQVVHLCGKDKVDASLTRTPGYVQYEYIKAELADLFAAADLGVSRAGANAICELLALKKPNILIPLGADKSRGDQILNAHSFEKQGFSFVLEEQDVTNEALLEAITDVYARRASYVEAMEQSGQGDAIETIINLMKEVSR